MNTRISTKQQPERALRLSATVQTTKQNHLQNDKKEATKRSIKIDREVSNAYSNKTKVTDRDTSSTINSSARE